MMNDPPPTQEPLPPLATLIKPDQVSKLANFSAANKVTYFDGITKLWNSIENQPQESSEYQHAYKKLAEVSRNIRTSLRKYHSEQIAAQQSSGIRPIQQGQQNQHDVRQQGQSVPATGAPQPQPQSEKFFDKVLQTVQAQNFVIPPNVNAQGQEAAKVWLQDAKHKYAQHLQRFEAASLKLQDLAQITQTRQNQGKAFTPEEQTHIQTRKFQLNRTRQEAQEYITRFKSQQEFLKKSQAQASNAGVPALDGSRDPNTQMQNLEHPQGVGGPQSIQQHMPPNHQGQPHTVSSALDAARSQVNHPGRSAMSPVNAGQPGRIPTSQAPNPQNGVTQGQKQNSQPPQNMISGPGPPSLQKNSPQVTMPQPTPSQGPHPLSHQAAVAQAAQSYSQPPYQQVTPQSSTHAHPQMGNRDPQNNTNVKMPIPKDLKIPQPQPVTMGPARPTLSGGPSNSAMGSMGQPAIQKHPGYVLEGEGERVLSKKKLEELVRQVTGGSGGEGEEGEGLTAEVEEVKLIHGFLTSKSASSFRLLKSTPDSSPSRRRLRRPSHRQRLPPCQTPPVIHAGTP